MEQQRADNSFYASIKNSTQAPNNINTSPFSKANIPLPNVDGNYLMMMYAIIPNQQCTDKIFSDYLHNGYVYDADDDINKFINRKYMNILSISPNDKIEDILNIWEKKYNNKIFNNKYWFTRALSFLGETHNFYMTPYLVNVTNYKSDDYIHNIEIEPYNIEIIKQDINGIITNWPEQYYPASINEIWQILKDHNQYLTDEIINELTLTITENTIIINTKPTSVNYEGQVVIFAKVYNAIVEYGASDEITLLHIYNFNQLSFIVSPKEINFLEGNYSVNAWYIRNITFCNDITINYISNNFLRGCTYFNQPLTLPNSITSIGYNFMYETNDMTNIIDFGDLTADVISPSNNSLSNTHAQAPSYIEGIKIKGTHAVEIKNLLPDRDIEPYRKLIIVNE